MTSAPDQPRRSGGYLWGRRRVGLGISLNQLAERAGIGKGLISLMENGRLIPTAAEYDRITNALDELEHQPKEATA